MSFLPVITILGAGGLVFALLGGGGDSPNKGKRVVPPKSNKAKRAAKTVVCNCYRSGVQKFDALVACALSSIYPDADLDWSKANIEAQTDGVLHPDTERAVRLVRKWATSFLKLQTDAERTAWCKAAEPDPGPGPGPAPTPGPDLGPRPDPGPMPEPQRVARVRAIYQSLRQPEGRPSGGGGYWQPAHGQYPTSLLNVAKEVLRDYGVGSPTTAQKREYALLIERSDWNRGLYGRNAKDGETIQHNGKTSRAAFLPRHKDADAAILGEARRPTRNIRNDGSKKGGGAKFGVLWLPGLNAQLLEDSDIVVADPALAEPPVELLTLLDAAP